MTETQRSWRQPGFWLLFLQAVTVLAMFALLATSVVRTYAADRAPQPVFIIACDTVGTTLECGDVIKREVQP